MRWGRGAGRSFGLAAGAAVLAGLLIPGVAAAHPLGNFTINHYVGLDVTSDAIRLDVVIDQAEIPTFQERRRLDVDGDGDVSDAESAAAQEPECRMLAESLALTEDGTRLDLELIDARLSFPMGAGLPTMRLECAFDAVLRAPLTRAATFEFSDGSSISHLGWREIVVEGDGVDVEPVGEAFLTRSLSERLTAYPADRLTHPLMMESTRFVARPGTPTTPSQSPAAVPGTGSGTPSDVLPAIFAATDLSLSMVLLAIATAAGLGIVHALTPGHGKTLMAAYLVGSRGTAVHAVGLGLSVTLAHTVGILGLGAVVLFGQGLLPPDVVARVLPAAAALAILALGSWMLASEVRRIRAGRPEHEAHHPRSAPSTVSWRGLFLLGLAGGIVPSASALLILLGAIAAGRPAFGILLVIAFGLGMAVVLGGVGVATVRARGWAGRASAASSFRGISRYAPVIGSVVVVGVGAWLTIQSLVALAT